MKKTIVVAILLLIPTWFLNIPEYKELNNLIIIKEIEVKCTEKEYQIKLKEIIPEKEEDGIEYKYKNYERKGTNLNEIKTSLEENTKKKFYYKKAKVKVTNCNNKKDIIKIFKRKKD